MWSGKLAVLFAATGGNCHAQHNLLAQVVLTLHESEAASLLRLVDRPAGKAAGHLGDVLLGVAAVDAEGV